MDYIDFNNINDQLIETFKELKFEEVFKEKMATFNDKMVSQINNNIYIFGTIIDLIHINMITQDKSLLPKLKDKYKNCIKKMNLKNEEEQKEIIKIIAKFADIIYIQEKNLDFLEKHINKLNKIKFFVYNEIIKKCQNEEYKQMKDFIFKKFINDKENNDNLITLIDTLSKSDKIQFLDELIKNCLFTKEEFYSYYENPKLSLLFSLYEKGVLVLSNEDYHFADLEEILKNIKKDFDGDITKKELENFLKNGEDFANKRLGLIKILFSIKYDTHQVYLELKKINEEINEDIKELIIIKNSLLIFHRYTYLDNIKEITELIKDLQEKEIKYYKSHQTKEKIQIFKGFKTICDEVNVVQHLILFNVIYDEECGNEVERFNESKSKMDKIGILLAYNEPADKIYNTFKNIFDKIKDILSYNESKADQLISQIKDTFQIQAKTELIKDLTIIFKSKKYEMDLNSIIYFFENFNPKDINWNKNFPKGFEELSKMDLKKIKKILNELKDKGIYDYEKKENYFKLFTSLYGKKEAIDFLITKINQDITYLGDRIDPIIQNLNLKDIEDAEECIKIFSEFKDKDNFTILEYIKEQLNEEQISKFESYSKNYSAILDLDRNDNSSFNIFGKVDKIIINAKLEINQDNEEFYYGENRTNMKELIHLKNNICIKTPEKTEDTKDIFQIKCDKLLFFKDIVSELEIIYENMNVLRIKGCSLPIIIIIEINYPNRKYSLNNKEINIKGIKDFLFKAKTEQIYQLDLIYKQQKYLRFLYGMQFRKVIKHLEEETCLTEIKRYILNNTNSKENIIDGIKINPKIVSDYTEAESYKLYIENSFKNISDYIMSLFEKNNTSLEKHYNKMLIKVESKYTGFYSYKCENDESMEEFILYIFLEKTKCYPVAQNVLITNEGTSSEEIQAFFYRAILCYYNALFVVEINDSFSEYQQNIMNIYINKILNESEKNMFKSCIIFIYKQNNSFLNELEKFNIQEIGKNEGIKKKKKFLINSRKSNKK